jgi:hypothetical protein
MGLSLNGASLYNAVSSLNNPTPPPQLQKEQDRANQLQAQYGENAPSISLSNPSADTFLNQIKSKNLSHIVQHEQAHQQAAGGLAGAMSIHYDANGVAIAGEVPISIPALDFNDPATSYKLYQQVYNSAMAPSDPSGADASVAARAQGLMGQAQVLMGQKKQMDDLKKTPGV